MASINLKKCKQGELAALLRHCDADLRAKADHSNVHINKELTYKNIQIGGSYVEVKKRFDDTLAELDSKKQANTRCDRVAGFCLEGVLPEPDADKDTERQRNAWITGIENILKAEYPEVVVLAKYIHYDEAHEYYNVQTGKRSMSMAHMHMFIIPIINGRLCGKKFFPNPSSLRRFHRKVDELTQSIYGFSYGNGSKKKSYDTVEHLKIESEKAEIEERRTAVEEKEKELINRQAAIRQQEQIVEDREQQVNRREAKMMAFLNSEIGKKAMQEYREFANRKDPVPQHRGKQGGKIKPYQNEFNLI